MKPIRFNSSLGTAFHNFCVAKFGERNYLTKFDHNLFGNDHKGSMLLEYLGDDIDSYREIIVYVGFDTPEDELAFILQWS